MDALPPTPESTPEWVIQQSDDPADDNRELVDCAKRMWPRVLAYAKRQNGGFIFSEDREPLAVEVWENVLRSVCRTRARLKAHAENDGIDNLEAYLFGVFRHRFNRVLRRERKRRELLKSVPPEVLAQVPPPGWRRWRYFLDRHLQIQQIVERMDGWTREVWTSRCYGYSWREIANRCEMTESQAKMKFRHAIARIRKTLSGRRRDSKNKKGGTS